MKHSVLTVVILCLMSTLVFAAGPEVIWVGGSMKISDESSPGYTAEALASLGQVDSMYLFTEPMLLLKDGELGLDLGVGTRIPVLSGQAVAGYNLFFDYTSDNNHKRIGTGLEFFHPSFSGHLNFYLPISDDHSGEEALPGLDITMGIPIPDASFISLWPSIYYYDGKDEDNLKGIGLEVRIQPTPAIAVSIGGRNDTLQAGRDSNELYAKLEVTIPMKRLGKDLFAFDMGQYPLDINAQMAQRVVRESFITYEKKRR
jgi:hypothetical protein